MTSYVARRVLSTLPVLVGIMASVFLMLHLVLPLAVVRQQVTKPAFPQVDRAAQCFTAPLQRFGSVPAFTASFATRVAQRTKAP